MTDYINLGGKDRPIRFGFAGLLEYEKRTGRKALADFAELSSGIQGVSVTMIVDLLYAGLASGCRKEKVNVDFDDDDVADWITDDQSAVEKVMTAFADSFPQGGNATAEPTAAAAPLK